MVVGGVNRARQQAVFVCYSHADVKWRERFITTLAPLTDRLGVEVWADEYIVVGDEWRRAIDDRLERATHALVLVSAELLASRFVREVELPTLARRARLVCVLVGECLFEEVPELERVQWPLDPALGPLGVGVPKRRRMGQVVQACRKLAALLDRAVSDPSASSPRPPVGGAEAVAVRGGLAVGALSGVPDLPREFVAREELAEITRRLGRAGSGALGISGNVRALGLHGHGGVGKSVLACALAHDEDVQRLFPDGVFWVTVGQEADLVGAQLALLAQLGIDAGELRSSQQVARRLREVLAAARCLLIVDDVWSGAAAAC